MLSVSASLIFNDVKALRAIDIPAFSQISSFIFTWLFTLSLYASAVAEKTGESSGKGQQPEDK